MTDYHKAYSRIRDGEGECPECGSENLRVDDEAPFAGCNECNYMQNNEGLWNFLD